MKQWTGGIIVWYDTNIKIASVLRNLLNTALTKTTFTFSFTAAPSHLFIPLKLHCQSHCVVSVMSYQVEQHCGAGGAEERSAGLNVTPAELPAGVCRDQVPDPGQKKSHRCDSVHGQRPGRGHGSAETPLHNGRSTICPGAQTVASTGIVQMLKKDLYGGFSGVYPYKGKCI